MPKETDRLKLPLPLGNENVTRESINGIFEKIDAGVATREDLETLRQMMGEMDTPDASLTVKGKVQLSNKIDGDSEELVPTEKALNDARLAAQKYVDDKPWQKYKLTQDDGIVKVVGSSDLNDYLTPGFYFSSVTANGPIQGSFYIEVIIYSSSFLLQRVTTFISPSITYTRIRNNNSWHPWVLQTPEENLWGAL
ncbi:pyocin knob domain-containing protein [Paenibacillus amylolyticus]|uniref:pyocin knob domain-containing protein n=1 Tax=Paenibacillus TaxID=44249 RepID=UPI000FD7A877|nr:pyocin knob domain-containing protein [Paenibacillus amylolyticus]